MVRSVYLGRKLKMREGKPQKGAGRAEMINVAGKYFSFLFSCN
jgi:hypothetical protein